MAKIKLNGDTSGYIEISAPAVSGNNTLELGPGTKILTNLDNTFTGVSTFTSGLHVTGDVGIGIDNPALRAHIYSTAATDAALIESTQNFATLRFKSALNSSGPTIGIDGAGGLQLDQKDTSKYISFAIGSERLRIKSDGDVYIGPSSHHNDNGANSSYRTLTLADITNGAQLHLRGQSPKLYLDVTGGGNGEIYYDTGDLRILSGEPGNAGSTERLRIGSDGHLSYKNSSPPAWSTDSGYANATLGSSAYLRTDTDVNSNFFTLGSNAYRGSSTWQHVNSGWATQLQQSAHTGDLYYSSSSTSGSADGTITWVEHFRATSAGNFGIGENSPADRLVVQKTNASGDVAARIKNDTTTDGSASTPTTASLYLTTSTGDFNTFYIQARRNDNDTHFGYSNPRDGGHTPNMIISNEGRVTMPNQPAFSVRRSGNQSIAHNTNTKVQWNSEIFDVGGHFDSSTNYRFTAPVAGKYLFLGHLYVYSTLQVEAKIYKNGSIYKRFSGPVGSGGNDNPNGMDFMDIVDLSVNDFIEIFAYHYRSGDTNTVSIYGGGDKETSFVGYLLG